MSTTAWMSALRMLAARRLSEAQLRERLQKKGFEAGDIQEVISRARREGYIDDKLYASLYLQSSQRSLGDRRLIGNLVRRGLPHELAVEALSELPCGESERLTAAYAKLKRQRPGISLPSAARGLERLGFPTPAIYHFLRSEGLELFQAPDL